MELVRKVTGWVSDLTRAELRRVLPIASAYGLVLASLYLLKPARNALFLSHMGVGQLPYVLLLVAVAGAATAVAYGRFARAMRTDRLIRLTFVILMLMLVGFRLLLPLGWGWVYYVFFIWVALYGVLTTSLIWLLANAVFTTREARRVFGFIGTGGIAGAILGGFFTGWVVDVVGTENLLLACIIFLAGSLALLRLTPAAGAAAEERRPRRWAAAEDGVLLKDILGADLLRTLALMTGLVAAIAVIVDIQFNEMVDQNFPDQDAKTAFFGSFFAYLSGLSFIIQLFLTPVLLRTAGAGFTIMILPVAMGVGSAAMLLVPGLMSAVLAKGADGGFRHSVHKAASEVIFLPVPAASKKTAKLFLDTAVDSSATGVGALVVVALTGPLGLGYSSVSLVAVALVAATLAIAPKMRNAYIDAFRRALEGRAIDVSALTTNLSEAAILKAILPALSGDNPRQVLYALDLLKSARSPAIVDAVTPLLTHGSAEVRRRALEVLQAQGAGLDVRKLTPMLEDEDEGVRREAMHALTLADDVHRDALLTEALDSGDIDRQTAALGCIARSGDDGTLRLLTPGRVVALVENAPASATGLRRELLAALCAHPDPDIAPELLADLDRAPIPIQQAAIEGMGRSRNPRHIDFLLSKLTDSRLRRDARRSLALYGDPIVAATLQEIDQAGHGPRLRQALARVLEDVGTQAATDALMAHLTAADPALRRVVLRSLSRLRQSKSDLIFSRDAVRRALQADVERFFDLARVLRALGAKPGATAPQTLTGAERATGDPASSADVQTRDPGLALLRRAAAEKQSQLLEDIFLLLGLRHPAADISAAYQGILSPRKPIRASALEFLDNVLAAPVRPLVLPMLDPPAEGICALGASTFPKPLDSRRDALVYLLRTPDPWLRACAVYCVNGEDPDPVPDLVRAAVSDPDPIVRETAETAMSTRVRADGHR